MAREIVYTSNAIPPLPVYSQAVKSDGKVYVSGSIGCTSDMKLVPGGVQDQTRAALNNMKAILEASGSGLQHIVKANIYLSNIQRDFAPMNVIYTEFFPKDPPARTCVGVAALPLGADVEIECIAELP